MKQVLCRAYSASLLAVFVAMGCGDGGGLAGPTDELGAPPARLTKAAVRTASVQQTDVSVTVAHADGTPAEGVEVAFSRSVSGKDKDYRWKGTTDASGQVEITVTADAGQYWKRGATGLYSARLLDAESGDVLDQWDSIPINGGRENVLTLPIGESVVVHPGAPLLKVMTRNIYLGASINPVLRAPSLEAVPGLVTQTWATVQATNFPDRAKAIAREIASERPHLVGLQEVSLFRRQFPGDFLAGNPTPAEEVVFDFLAILLGELEARGLTYQAVAAATGIDIELPSATGEDIRLTNRDVILARAGVQVTNVQEANYAIHLTLPIGGPGGPPTRIPRSWVAVDATVENRTFRFVSTHLEQGAFEEVQVAQGNELLQTLSEVSLPVVLVGDFNSAADGITTGTYGNLVATGLVDVWKQAYPYRRGFTCCFDEELLSPAGNFNRRIDHMFVRDDFTVVNARILGRDRDRRSPSGLWPSDHAGMVASLRLPAE